MRLEREKARARGTAAEWLATAWLIAKGYRVIARQFRAKGGELDIVALTPFWTARTIAFVEVRARGTVAQAIESVGAVKRRRVETAAVQFCARRPRLNAVPRRFDLIVLAPGRLPHHVIDAWRP
jgi:putative endonuclease